jgi:formate C-acetyltransferase
VGEIFTKYRKTHNDGVFDATPRKAPPSDHRPARCYGRGRIIGGPPPDRALRRDFLITERAEKHELDERHATEDVIRLRELAEQIRSLRELKEMASRYGHDISRQARNAREAVRWSYFGSRRRQAAERRGNVGGTPVHLLGHLFERDLREAPHRVSSENHRRPGDQNGASLLSAPSTISSPVIRYG